MSILEVGAGGAGTSAVHADVTATSSTISGQGRAMLMMRLLQMAASRGGFRQVEQ
jgi:hypothetical protein